MDAETLLPRRELRKRLDRLFSSIGNGPQDLSIVKAVPLAFPITSNVFNIRERATVENGLVERYVMETVQRFGPIRASAIESMLGVEEEIVRRMLQNAVDMGQGVKMRRSLYSMEEAIDLSGFSSEADHLRRFIFNGVTGDLMAIRCAEIADTERLFPQMDEFKVHDANGQETPIRVFLRHSMPDVKDCLLRAMAKNSPENRMTLGIPTEVIELGEEKYSERELLWIPAFLILKASGEAEVHGMEPEAGVFLHADHATRDWLSEACNWSGPITSGVDFERLQENLNEGFEGIAAAPTDVPNQVALGGDAAAWEPEIFLRADNTRSWLPIALKNGYYWDVLYGDIVSLVPGNAVAAKTMCLLNGVDALYRVRSAWNSSRDDCLRRNDWWDEHVSGFVAGLPEGVSLSEIPISEFDRCVDRHPDTVMQEWYEEWE